MNRRHRDFQSVLDATPCGESADVLALQRFASLPALTGCDRFVGVVPLVVTLLVTPIARRAHEAAPATRRTRCSPSAQPPPPSPPQPHSAAPLPFAPCPGAVRRLVGPLCDAALPASAGWTWCGAVFLNLLSPESEGAYHLCTLCYARARLPRAHHRAAHPTPSRPSEPDRGEHPS